MAKSKKKSSSKAGGTPSRYRMQSGTARPLESFDKSHSKLEREMDPFAHSGEDQFHKNRDSILLEHDRGHSDEADLDLLSSDNEVYGLDLPSHAQAASASDDDAEEEEEEEDLLDDDDEEEEGLATTSNSRRAAEAGEAPRGRFAKISSDQTQDQDQDQDQDQSEESEEAASASDSEEETWAPGSYHATRRAPGEVDSSDDEALEMEAEEARRLQMRARAGLVGEDFVEEEEEEEEERGEKVGRLEREEEEKEEHEERVMMMGEEEAIAHLVRNHPETLALLDDFTQKAERIQGVEKDLEIVRKGDEEGGEHPALAIMELEHQALTTYLPTLAFYFSLLLQPSPSTSLLSKVLNRLSALRQALATMEELDLTSARYEDDSDGEEEEEEDGEEGGMLASEVWDAAGAEPAQVGSDSDEEEEGSDFDEEEEDRQMLLDADAEEEEDEDQDEDETSMLGGLSDAELEEIMSRMPAEADADQFIKAVEEAQARKQAPREVEGDDYEMNEVVVAPTTSKSKGKKNRSKKVVVPELAPLPSKRKIPTTTTTSTTAKINDDYLDPTSLSLTDLSDKSSARHSLRFHVSQVKQKTAKRESGHGRRMGGDDDLPRRSKENARREVLRRQEHGAVVGDGKGVGLDGEEWGEEDRRVARGVKGVREEEGEAGGEEDYYEMVKQGREEGRKAKKAKYDGDRLEEKATNLDLASGLTSGPRGASAQILRNKGLQPKRAKVNRNPRVKKRMAYDKAVKKVATMKSVYKEGADRSRYEGEKSGIGSKVVKSVRLGGQ